MSPKKNFKTFKKSSIVSSILLLSSLCIAPTIYAAEETAVAPVPAPTVGTAKGAACPLNSGGPSLANSHWRLASIYGQVVPTGLEIYLDVGQKKLSGFSGCNTYNAQFHPVGYSGFKVDTVDRTRKPCKVEKIIVGGPAVNFGDWEGSYIRTLMRMGSVQQEGNELHFFNRNGQIGMIMQRRNSLGSIENAEKLAKVARLK